MGDRRIIWVTSNRFDLMPDKSTWLETARELCGRGYRVDIVTGWGRERYYPDPGPVNMVYLRALDFPLAYRITILVNACLWIMRYGSRNDIVILNPDEIWLAPLLWIFGRTNLHLDIRTLPIRSDSPKDRLDRWLFWSSSVGRLKGFFKGYSFITERLRMVVEKEFDLEFSDHVIWSSGVAAKKFRFALQQESPGNRQSKFRLFYHGSLSPDRGLDVVIKACAELEKEHTGQIELVILGGGPELERLSKLVLETGCEKVVDLVGLVPYEEIPKWIASADCCICPLPDLLQWRVSSPLKVLEYMASAKPLILTPIAAHLDVAAKLDFVVWTEGFAVDDFCLSIQQARDNLNLLTQAAQYGPVFVERNYDWRVQAGHLAEYLDRTFLPASTL